MKFCVFVTALVFVLGMARSSEGAAVHIIKIQSLRSGAIILDGQQSTMMDLQRVLTTAKNGDATVWYYREGAGTDPTPAQFEAFKAIVDARLPISLSTKPDFSDYVGADGQSHVRGQ